MTNPYSVPIEDLDTVHVTSEALVEGQDAPLRWAAGGLVVHPYGDGATGDADGD